MPDAKVVLVRTRGLGGSRFGWSCRADNPNLVNGILAGIGWCLASLILFLPRRKVQITLEVLDRSRLPELRRELINPWFEAWYNKEGPETPLFVPYHLFLGRRTYEFPKRRSLEGIDLEKIKPETQEGVFEILEKKLKRPLPDKEKEPDTTLDELALDSLDRMDVNLTVERRFGFSSDQVPATVGELLALAQGQLKKGAVKEAPPLWFKPVETQAPGQILGEIVAEAFVNRALGSLGDVAVADDLAGVLTYEKMLVGAAGDVPPAVGPAGCQRRPDAARRGGVRHRLPGPAPGRQAAGAAQLDDRTGQPGTCRPTDAAGVRHHLKGVHRPHQHRGQWRQIRLPGGTARQDRQAGTAEDAAAGALVPGRDSPAGAPERLRSSRRWCCSPAARRKRPRRCR